MVYSDQPTREGILDAVSERHTYGPTDNILLEVKMGPYFMGDEINVPAPLPTSAKIRGTAAVSKVVVIRDRETIYSTKPDKQDVSFTHLDNSARSGKHYYYVRVEQSDGQLAWGSPIWVTYR